MEESTEKLEPQKEQSNSIKQIIKENASIVLIGLIFL